ncbi:MAG: ABC transporter permease [Nanoarchaeota archaeon]|nr:ABC transporter permease [Nanoarchaeota archaeon]MBU1245963.1 ABC transporter permease [Nanoarchaeota archaeon]MBU1445359.1 ABC transporter permease [Nanoarchaeota archaeon]MBU2443700.1 ABC transporter permease [Nanoarchaeota archaeon]
MNKKIIFPIITLFAILLIWQLLVYFSIINSLFLPAPLTIAKSLIKNTDYFLGSIGITIKHILIGYFIGIGLAIPLGLVFGWKKNIELTFSPIFLVISTIPVVTFLPIFILWFGLNEIPIYLCSIIAAFFPAFLNTFHGVKKIDKSFIEVAENFKIKSINKRIIFPASLPYISNGLRQAIQITFLVTPPAEMIMGDIGLGGFIWKSADLFKLELVILGMVTLGIIGFSLFKIYDFIEKKYLLKWMNVRKDAEN